MIAIGPLQRAVRASLVLVIAVVLQTSLISDLTVFGATGDIMQLDAISAGFVGGPDRGAWYGFVAGLLYDLMLDTPVGLSALTYCIVAYMVGALQGSVLRAAWWIPVVTAFVASVVGISLYVVLGRMVGQSFPFDEVPRIAAVVAVFNAFLVLPVTRVMRWAVGATDPRLGALVR
jgi:rod shape-determining protein MreD